MNKKKEVKNRRRYFNSNECDILLVFLYIYTTFFIFCCFFSVEFRLLVTCNSIFTFLFPSQRPRASFPRPLLLFQSALYQTFLFCPYRFFEYCLVCAERTIYSNISIVFETRFFFRLQKLLTISFPFFSARFLFFVNFFLSLRICDNCVFFSLGRFSYSLFSGCLISMQGERKEGGWGRLRILSTRHVR